MRLELLHDMFFIHVWLEFVTVQCIVPVLLSLGQYLQWLLLQKENPRSLLELPFARVDCVAGRGWVLICMLLELGGGVFFLLKKFRIVFWMDFPLEGGGVSTGSGGGSGTVLCRGSTW